MDRLRSIGDGIAWRFLKYDRAILRLLAEHAPVSTPEFNKGLISELNELVRLAEEEEHDVLLNAITNFLRVGDITTCHLTTGNFDLVEVKSSKHTDSRIQRQGEYHTLVQEGLQSGVSQLGGMKIRRVMAQKPLRSHIRSVEHAMREAEERLGASRKFGDYLSVIVFAPDKIVDSVPEENWDQLRSPLFDRLFSVCKSSSDIVLPVLDSLFLMSHFSPNIAPYTIYPIHPRFRFALITGEIVVMSMLNVSGLAHWLEKRGWTVTMLQVPDQLPDNHDPPVVPVFRMFKGDLEVEIDLSILMVAAAEFWMPESVEELASTIMQEVPPRSQGEPGQYSQVNFPNTGKHAWD